MFLHWNQTGGEKKHLPVSRQHTVQFLKKTTYIKILKTTKYIEVNR